MTLQTHNASCTCGAARTWNYCYYYDGWPYFHVATRQVAIAWETQYEYATRTSYWPDSWTTSSSAITSSTTKKVQYRYKKK